MATLRDDLLPVLRDGRQLIQDFGLRPYRVILRTRTWDGGEVKMGASTDVDLEIIPRPKVEEADGDATLIVTKIDLGKYTPAMLNPADADDVETFYVVTGPNGTHNYATVHIDTSPRFGFSLRLSGLTRATPY